MKNNNSAYFRNVLFIEMKISKINQLIIRQRGTCVEMAKVRPLDYMIPQVHIEFS